MKFRDGFVSNSSSSSFVVFGVRFSTKEAVEDFFGDGFSDDICSFEKDGLSFVENDDEIFFGKLIDEGEDELSGSCITLQELMGLENKILDALSEMTVKHLEETEVKLYTGVRAC